MNLRVKVYYNLHKKCLSVMANEGDRKGLVIAHCDRINLTDVVFRVSEAGRKRVLDQKRKNVHAFIYGTISEAEFTGLDTQVTYNPYKYSSFVNKTTEAPIFKANQVRVEGRAIFAS